MARGKPLLILSPFVLALLLTAPVAYGTTLISDADGSFVSANLAPHMEYFVDRSGAMDFNRIQQLPDAAWVPVSREVISFGFSEEVYWLRATIRNAS
ncbi:MAG: 7TM-DISM domain-containing protein, partial [Pseudomonadota bacterium]